TIPSTNHTFDVGDTLIFDSITLDSSVGGNLMTFLQFDGTSSTVFAVSAIGAGYFQIDLNAAGNPRVTNLAIGPPSGVIVTGCVEPAAADGTWTAGNGVANHNLLF